MPKTTRSTTIEAPEREQDRDPLDKLLSDQAFHHFCTRIGPKPTPTGLLKYYQQKRDEDPDNRQWITTLDRNKIWRWYRQDNWQDRFEEWKRAQIEADFEDYERTRRVTQHKLNAMIDPALTRLMGILADEPDNKIVLNAITEILDRTGNIDHSKIRYRQDKQGEPRQSPEVDRFPSPDSDDEEILAFLRRQR